MDISAIRKSHELTQADLAAKLGLNQGTVSRWERGKLKMKARDVIAVNAAIDELVAERSEPKAAA